MQEFNKITTTSNFIKNLLLNTYLPLIRTVRDYDYLIKDRLYIYRCNVIKCTESGYIITGPFNKGNGKKRAGFRILEEYHFGDQNDRLCTNFQSNCEAYDYLTHERLGKYLRSLRDMYELNLMPLYNCFSNQIFSAHHIFTDKISKTGDEYNTKIYKVPIRFNTTYTVCMENLGLTTFAPAFIKHGNLITLNNTRFGNNVDATNKYIRLHRDGVIYNRPNMRFRDPLKIRFNNVPETYEVPYNTFKEKLIPESNIIHNDTYFKGQVNPGLLPDDENTGWFSRLVDSDGVSTYVDWEYHSGYTVMSEDDPEHLSVEAEAEESLRVMSGVQETVYRSINPSTGLFDNEDVSYKTVNLIYRCSSNSVYEESKAPYYEWDVDNGEYVEVEVTSKDFNTESFDRASLFYFVPPRTAEGYYKLVNGKFIPMSQLNEQFSINNTYAERSGYFTSPWYEKDSETGEFVKSEDAWIDLNKDYYATHKVEDTKYYTYDVTEENCALYDYLEDSLYMLIQVPASFDSNILILEGDYDVENPEKFYDRNLVQNFPGEIMDKLFTSNLKLMQIATKQIIPFSDTLMEFLLWNAINNMDSINGNMDRLLLAIEKVLATPFTTYFANYWYPEYRRLVHKVGNEYNSIYVDDNIGYVTRKLEEVIYKYNNNQDIYIDDPTYIDIEGE